jgi:hypothetical protein
VEALPQPIRVLLAGARIRGGVRLGYDTIDPHGSSEELVAAVHRAYRGGPLRAERLS